MNYKFMLTLEHLALVKVSTSLWNVHDVRALIKSIPLAEYEEKDWRVIEDKVFEKPFYLPVPKSLRNKLLGFIRPIGLEILKWLLFHFKNFISIDVPKNLCWTLQGTIDKKKTAEILIRDEHFDIVSRYKLSCIYCLPNDILQLWNKMPEECKKSFYSKEDPRHVCLAQEQVLVVFWTYDIREEVDRMDIIIKSFEKQLTPYQYAFEYAACSSNKPAVEYFLQKLTPEERRASLLSIAVCIAKRYFLPVHSSDCCTDGSFKGEYADILCFLLSKMTEELQNCVFDICAHEVLLCFLEWPWQIFFVKIGQRVLPFLDEMTYSCLLFEIIDKVEEFADFDYRNLFGEFWKLSPDTYKKYVISEVIAGSPLLSCLFKIKDKENITLILNELSIVEKERLFFYGGGKDICQYLAHYKEWDLIKFFVGECMSSQDRLTVREKFLKRTKFCNANTKKDWNKFFKVLDNHIYRINKWKKGKKHSVNNRKRKKKINLQAKIICSRKQKNRNHVVQKNK